VHKITGGDGQRELVLQTTKTRVAVRLLQIDTTLVACLREHRRIEDDETALREAACKNRLKLLFTTDTGAPIHVSDLAKHFKSALGRAQLPPIRFHDLRHTAATLLLANGVPLVTVTKSLGHSSPAITAAIYAHALDESKSTAIAALSQQLRTTI
jgi:integrase